MIDFSWISWTQLKSKQHRFSTSKHQLSSKARPQLAIIIIFRSLNRQKRHHLKISSCVSSLLLSMFKALPKAVPALGWSIKGSEILARTFRNPRFPKTSRSLRMADTRRQLTPATRNRLLPPFPLREKIIQAKEIRKRRVLWADLTWPALTFRIADLNQVVFIAVSDDNSSDF